MLYIESPPPISEVLEDAVGEFFGTFLLLFILMYVVTRPYMPGETSKYFFISLMLLVCRT
jgi:glycerol uptake facilitator-like aquaporin